MIAICLHEFFRNLQPTAGRLDNLSSGSGLAFLCERALRRALAKSAQALDLNNLSPWRAELSAGFEPRPGRGEEMAMICKKLVYGAGLTILFAGSAVAEEANLSVSINDHRFAPAEIHAPANTAITLNVKNLDPTPEEFESKPLRVEKVIAGGGGTVIHIRPLSPGRYRFFGDYHEDTAEGFLIVE
jgi:hypothetical protein